MIVTFYSYKGGVGRSMAMVNVGEILANAGYDVILCDFDLEAPGLERYVVDDAAQMREFRRHPGIIDLLEEYKDTLSAPSGASSEPVDRPDFRELAGLSLRSPRSFSNNVAAPSGQKRSGSLGLLCAGRRDGRAAERYAKSVQRFDWSDFYDRWAGAAYFDFFRAELIEGQTIVLIDSRTGVTELGGVCTHHLADMAVLLSGPNDINIEGTRWMLESLAGSELTGLRRGRPLRVLPVASRVETTSQVRELAAFRRRFETEFSGRIPAEIADGEQFLREAEIPYVPYFALTEQVVARSVDTRHRELYAAYETIARAVVAIGTNLELIRAPRAGGFRSGAGERRDAPSIDAILQRHGSWVASGGTSGSRAVLRSRDLRDVDLMGKVLRGADLTEVNLEQADLRGMDLTDAILRGAELRGARLDDANLTRADLTDAVLTLAELPDAVLDFARLNGADCVAANLTRSRLRGAFLNRARLDRASMEGADLRQADLTEATMQGTALGGADLRGAIGVKSGNDGLEGAVVTPTTQLDQPGAAPAGSSRRLVTTALSGARDVASRLSAVQIITGVLAVVACVLGYIGYGTAYAISEEYHWYNRLGYALRLFVLVGPEFPDVGSRNALEVARVLAPTTTVIALAQLLWLLRAELRASVKPSGALRMWAVTAALGLVAIMLGLTGFGSYLGSQPDFAHAGFFDLLYYTLQLFVLGSTPLGGPPYGAALTIASFLAPLTTLLGVLQAVSAAFRVWWDARLVSRDRGHAVVVGAGPAAFVLAQRLAAMRTLRRHRVVLVGSDVGADVAARHGVRVVDGDPGDEATLRAAGVPGAARVFALADTGAANAATALQVRVLNKGDVAVHARVDDAELVAAMRARRLGAEDDRGFRVDFFSVEQVAAVALLDELDPGPDAAVVGSDRFAAAVSTELARRLRWAGRPAPVPLVPCEQAGTLTPPSGTTYVCAADADEVLRIGMALLLSGHPRVVLCLGRRSALAGALEARLFDRVLGQLSVFGILDAACDPERLQRNALIEQLARALHAAYLREYGGSGQASDLPWERLDERFRDDNREQAENIGAKLAAINAIIVPAAPGLPPFRLDSTEVEELAELEHVRWLENKQRSGIVHGPTRTETTHPDLLPWEQLDEAVKEKDRMFVRGLPALLAAEDLAIVRRPGS